jgi:hypothetical protein
MKSLTFGGQNLVFGSFEHQPVIQPHLLVHFLLFSLLLAIHCR